MQQISRTLLEEYVVDKCWTSLAGLIRAAYIEGKGDALVERISGIVKENGKGGDPSWIVFFKNTVPALAKDAQAYLDMKKAYSDKAAGIKPEPKKPTSRRRR